MSGSIPCLILFLIPVGLICGWVVMFGLADAASRSVRSRSGCPFCRYSDETLTAEQRCPECGKTRDEAVAAALRPRPWLVIGPACLTLLLWLGVPFLAPGWPSDDLVFTLCLATMPAVATLIVGLTSSISAHVRFAMIFIVLPATLGFVLMCAAIGNAIAHPASPSSYFGPSFQRVFGAFASAAFWLGVTGWFQFIVGGIAMLVTKSRLPASALVDPEDPPISLS